MNYIKSFVCGLALIAGLVNLNAATLWEGRNDFLGQKISFSMPPTDLTFAMPEGFPTNYANSKAYLNTLSSTNPTTKGWIMLTTAKVEAFKSEISALAYISNNTNISAGFRPFILLQVYKITGNQGGYVGTLQSVLAAPNIAADNVIMYAKFYTEYLHKTGGSAQLKSDVAKAALARAYHPTDITAVTQLFNRVNASYYTVQDYVLWLRRVKGNQTLPTDQYTATIPIISTLQSAILVNDPTSVYK